MTILTIMEAIIVPILKQIVFGGFLYITFSFTEYGVHRYLMHGEKNNEFSKNHWTHHEHTEDDMDLRKSNNYNEDTNKYLGLYFVWKYTVAVFFTGLLEAYVLYIFLPIVPWWSVIIWVALFAIYQSSFWNTIHPDIHNVSLELSWREGIPGWNGWKQLFENIGIYNWLKENHTLHHLRKKERKGNYNVTLPGADYVLGTMYKNM